MKNEHLSSLMSSERHDWETPHEILERVARIAPIGLDPCCHAHTAKSPRFYTETDDGLVQPWHGHGLVFVNPPYGRAVQAWAAKALEEHARLGTEIVMLVAARTDTRWFQALMRASMCVCLLSGRVTFVGAQHGAPFPSAVIYMGKRRQSFLWAFRDLGVVVETSRDLAL